MRREKGKVITLEQLRAERGMTQCELAAILNCTQSTISFWEKGKRSPNLKTATRVGILFDIPVENIRFASK